MTGTERPVAAWLARPRTILTFWIGYVALSINQSYVWEVVAHRQRAWHEPLAFALATAVIWVALTPFVIAMARWKRLERDTWRTHLLWHAAAILLCGLLDAAGDQVARSVNGLPPAFWPDYFRKLDLVSFYYAIIVGATHAADFYELYRRGELRSAELDTQLRTSQLEMLKAQLQPHFLFNTLNAVNALIYANPQAADHVVTRLAELLRMSLSTGPTQEISLAAEIELVSAYLDIQQTRLGNRLRFSIDAAPETETALVPAFLLQPLVENAVLHGVAPLVRGGTVMVSAERANDLLRLRVEDDGPGFGNPDRYGIGISNVRQRLERLYGDRQSFHIRATPPHGTQAEITIPFRSMERIPTTSSLQHIAS